MPANVQDFIIEPPAVRESAGLIRLQDQLNQNRAFDMQEKQKAEQDEWRKIALIRDLTDLSQYQTGSDVANEIGNRQAARVLQKYTAEAKNMSPSELLSKIQSEMSGVTSGMAGLKSEMAMSDQQLALLKQKFPELDMAALAKKVREDAITRRLKGDESFANPMEIQPSQIQLDNPEFLSDYVISDKTLQEAITNPKGLEDVGVATGNIIENMEFKGKKSPWKQENFTKEMLEKGGGFLPKGFVPELKTMEEPISTDILKGAKGEQLMGVPNNVLDQFLSNDNYKMQLLSNTKRKFPNYKDLTPEQKEAAASNTLRGMLDLDKTNFRFDRSQRAPMQRTTNTFNLGGAGANVNDIYGRIHGEMKRLTDYGEKEVKPNLFKGDEQKAISDYLQVWNAGKDGDDKIKLEDTWMELTGQDEIVVKDKDRKLLFTLPKLGTNLPKQANVKGKSAVVQQGEPDKSAKPNVQGKSYSLNGKSYSQSAVEEAAKKSGMSVDAYIKKAGLK